MLLFKLYFILLEILLCAIKIIVGIQLGDCECGVSNEAISFRIVGGEEVTPHAYPWLAAIYNNGELHCGGALINNLYILTAGHCVMWVNPKGLTVRLGMHDRRKDGISYKISQLITHPDFTSDYLHDTNDIALVKLATPVQYNEQVAPICLPHPLSDYTGRIATVAGWGRTGVNENPSHTLKKADIKIMSFNNCNMTNVAAHLADTMVCGYAINVDACQGDSGGPLTYYRSPMKVEQIGVVSWGIGCATPNIPGVYTKVTDFLDWIAETTSDAVYCSRN